MSLGCGTGGITFHLQPQHFWSCTLIKSALSSTSCLIKPEYQQPGFILLMIRHNVSAGRFIIHSISITQASETETQYYDGAKCSITLVCSAQPQWPRYWSYNHFTFTDNIQSTLMRILKELWNTCKVEEHWILAIKWMMHFWGHWANWGQRSWKVHLET